VSVVRNRSDLEFVRRFLLYCCVACTQCLDALVGREIAIPQRLSTPDYRSYQTTTAHVVKDRNRSSSGRHENTLSAIGGDARSAGLAARRRVGAKNRGLPCAPHPTKRLALQRTGTKDTERGPYSGSTGTTGTSFAALSRRKDWPFVLHPRRVNRSAIETWFEHGTPVPRSAAFTLSGDSGSIRFWLGHAAQSITDRYAQGLSEDEAWRHQWAESVAVGFSLNGLQWVTNVVSISSSEAA